MKDLDIGEVSRQSGVPASALRFYEDKGLISSNGRHGLRRQYPGNVLERLALIALGRASGFTLDDIARMFGPDGGPRLDRKLLAAKADALDHTIRRLIAMRNGLRHAAVCPAQRHTECPTFRRLVKVAGAGKLDAPEKSRRKPAPVRTSRRTA